MQLDVGTSEGGGQLTFQFQQGGHIMPTTLDSGH